MAAERVSQAWRDTIDLEHTQVSVEVNVGIASFGDDADTADGLIRTANERRADQKRARSTADDPRLGG